ncbi:MAG: apolipoprotein N-acyltransferase [Acidobacteria bacterium]|nr:apolipoprotein N-acyltransferase [Acidobacteriota bacterium]
MQNAAALDAPRPAVRRRAGIGRLARACQPTLAQTALAAASALLLVLSFPDFDLWPLAWVGLVPLLLAVTRTPARGAQAFTLGWLTGTLYFYGSCWWLTHSMIHYGGIPRPVAYLLLAPVTVIVGLFPAAWALLLARAARRWGAKSLVVAPFAWAALEWARLAATGQLWNALGYSQAYRPALIQPASWGGVYAVSFLILTTNAAVAFALLRKSPRSLAAAALAVALVALTVWAGARAAHRSDTDNQQTSAETTAAVVVALQANISPDLERSVEENDALVARHLSMSADALREWDATLARAAAHGRQTPDDEITRQQWRAVPRVVVWPESPMYFAYARDARFRETVAGFAREHRTSVLFNSLEPAPAGGAYNSAVMVDERGELVAQYDKIRLLPFGEYVPLPWWLGGALVGAIVGDFTPGADYKLLPVGRAQAGVFICFESAFPSLAREFADRGADVLVNISNDGYLGRTPVLRQHLANAVFRAVENRRHVLRVTNTGITARISPRGEVADATDSFRPDVRTWTVARAAGGKSFYTRHGDLFVALCAIITALLFVSSQWSVVRGSRAAG